MIPLKIERMESEALGAIFFITMFASFAYFVDLASYKLFLLHVFQSINMIYCAAASAICFFSFVFVCIVSNRKPAFTLLVSGLLAFVVSLNIKDSFSIPLMVSSVILIFVSVRIGRIQFKRYNARNIRI